MPRWGKIGKQRIVDEGPLKPFKDMSANNQMWQKGRDAKYDMETFDEVLVEQSKGFMDRPRRTESRSSSGTTQRACTSSLICRRSTRRK